MPLAREQAVPAVPGVGQVGTFAEAMRLAVQLHLVKVFPVAHPPPTLVLVEIAMRLRQPEAVVVQAVQELMRLFPAQPLLAATEA